jgi:hypothetical protein
MNKINIFLVALIMSLVTLSCTKDFEEINTNNNAPEKVTPQLLLPDIQRDMINQVLGESWGIGNIVIQHTAKNQFVNEDRYLWGEINGIWNTTYNKLRDIQNIIITAEETNDAGTKAVALVMRAWMFSLVTDAYGDIPYSEAIKAKDGIFYTKYDSQEAIYTGILADLKEANQLLGSTSGVVGGDLIYGGNLSKWRKLANALRVRYLIRISNKKSPAAELTEIINNTSANPLFAGNEDNATYTFRATAPDQFPLFSARSGSFNEYRASKFMLDTLVSLTDPRLTIFYRATPKTEGTANPVFIGLPNGLNDVDALTYAGGPENHSRVSDIFYENAVTSQGLSIAKGIIMTYAELQFLLAEAAAKGWISGTADTYYKSGINASFGFYGLTTPSNYMEKSEVKLTTSADDNLKKIGFQKWISLFYQGMEAWYDWRRTKIPTLKPAISNQNDGKIPVRFIYPIIEQGLNGPNRLEAVSRQGGDDINTLMWYLK